MMPGMSGFELCRKLRDVVDCPIVFLSARHAVSDRIEGLAIGGDDYLVKPFSIDELLARLQAHLRREQRGAQGKYDNRMLRFGELTISLQSYSMYYRGTPVKLTAREFEIVQLLVLRPGQVFSREQIYESVWGVDAVGDSSTITEHIKKIRAKMGEAGVAEDYISTVWGVGYRWDRR
ncbi:Sensory transduction protein regX3 [compost metagenome]